MSLIEGFEHITREDEPLAPYTRLGIGGTAEFFAEPTTQDELVGLVKRFSDAQLPIRLIGSGTNLIINDERVSGLVIHLAAPDFCELSVEGQTIRAGGGARLAHFVSTAAREGFAGPEQLVGIPGTVGGALHSNIGSHGDDIGTWVQSAEVLTRSGEILTRAGNSLAFSYRQSSLSELVILRATFQFEKEDPETLTRQLQKLWIIRRARQPLSEPRCIFVFKDPVGESANDLIEQCGLKGFQLGNVEVSDLDGNIFVARDGATAAEMLKLIDTVKQKVYDTVAVELQLGVDVW